MKFWNPYLAGIALGLVLLTTFLVMGKGLGASGAATRIGNFVATGDAKALDDWLVFEVLGVFLGSTSWWIVLTAVVAVLRSKVTIAALTWVNRISGAAILVFGVVAIVGALYR